MTCRRLRRLADATWSELDKNVDADKREGGNSPRERVLSSFVVHELAEWVSQEAHAVGWRDLDDILSQGMRIMTSGDLAADNHLFYIAISGLPAQTQRTYLTGFLQISDEQRNLLANNSPYTFFH